MEIKMSEAHLELTRNCNLRCRHCYLAGKTFTNELTTKDWFKIIDKLASLKTIKYCILLGGEPTLRADFYEILQYAIDNFPQVTVETNGTTPTDFSSYKCNISVSFESWNKEKNDEIRGTAIFDKKNTSVFELALRKLRTIENPKICRFTLYSDTDILKSLIMAEMYNAHAVFVPFLPIGSGKEIEHKTPNAQKLLESFRLVREFDLRVRGKNEWRNKHLIQSPQYYLWNSDLSTKFIGKFLKSKVCPAGVRRIFIDAKGNFTPCPYLFNLKMGDMLEKKVNKKFIYAKFLEFNESVRNIERKDKCKNCPIVNICDGGCSAMAIKNRKKTGKNCPLQFQVQVET